MNTYHPLTALLFEMIRGEVTDESLRGLAEKLASLSLEEYGREDMSRMLDLPLESELETLKQSLAEHFEVNLSKLKSLTGLPE